MQISNLTKTYNNKMVLNIESFTFEEEKIYAIIGANGSGKSTLGKCLAKVIKPDQNNIDFGELKDIGYMSQNNYAFAMSTIKNIMLGNKTENENKVFSMMDKFEMKNLAKQYAPKLSGGETAKMALMRILIKPRKFLILDEPTAAMDVKSTKQAEELIKSYQQENKSTLLIITHSIKQAARLADVVLFLHEGKLIEFGDPNEILNNPKTEVLKEFIDVYAI